MFFFGNLVVEVGGMVVFDCVAEGSPAPDIQWNVSPGDLHARFQKLTNGSLQVHFQMLQQYTVLSIV